MQHSLHKPLILQTKLSYNNQVFLLSVLIDSGSDGNFMDINTAQKIGLPLILLINSPNVFTADGRTLGPGGITHHSASITLTTSALHQEEVSFLITTTSKRPLILGNTWLRQHDPIIFWTIGEITK